LLLRFKLARIDEIDRRVMFEQLDVGQGANSVFQRVLDGATGGVGGMHDTPVAMAALAGQVIAIGVERLFVSCKLYAFAQQPADILRPALYHQLYGLGVAQAGACAQRVLNVRLDRVGGVEDRGDAALRIERVAFAQFSLGDHRDGNVGSKAKRQAQAGGTAADDEDVVSMGRAHVVTDCGRAVAGFSLN
jgi:hypothetical protein